MLGALIASGICMAGAAWLLRGISQTFPNHNQVDGLLVIVLIFTTAFFVGVAEIAAPPEEGRFSSGVGMVVISIIGLLMLAFDFFRHLA